MEIEIPDTRYNYLTSIFITTCLIPPTIYLFTVKKKYIHIYRTIYALTERAGFQKAENFLLLKLIRPYQQLVFYDWKYLH